ncbi:MAG: Rab family GTPase [Thiolinea sp.]
MIQKKICMLGSFSVGKTSLVKRYVSSLFSEKYLTTVGVKVDKKQVRVDGTDLLLMLWDIAGEDAFSSIRPAHLRGMAGYVLVVDGTRPDTLEVALGIHERIKRELGDLPVVFALNKADLKDKWLLDDDAIRRLVTGGYPVLETSAREDFGVDEMFMGLARQLIGDPVRA